MSGAKSRAWPAPRRPWLMAMQWHDLLFAHWPLPPESVLPFIPPPLTLDTWEGEAWVGIVPFRMAGVRPRRAPAVGALSAFPELNVRTYVTAEDKPGVWFFSLDAANPLAVRAARLAFHLPYFNASMLCRRKGEAVWYGSSRTHRGAPSATFAASYRPTGPVQFAPYDGLVSWLTDRYCLYSADRRGNVWRSEVNHARWPLQPAELTVETNTMAIAAGLRLPEVAPLSHFARRLDVIAWGLDRVGPLAR